jgi:hypothetical protein
MQERYLGDSHDYIKFALLRYLQRTLDRRIGVNWYLTDLENNGDGEQRAFLDNAEWKPLDKALFCKLEPFRKREYRTLENFKRDKILPKDTLFYQEKVCIQQNRSRWHEQALTALSQAGLIFLDQDNGFQVRSMTRRTQKKYALYKEASDYYERGQIVVAIQFANKVNPIKRAREVRGKLIQCASCSITLPVVRGRVTPNILFLVISPSDRAEDVRKALVAFEAKSPVVRGFKRIELVN